MQQERVLSPLLRNLSEIIALMREARSVRTLFSNVCGGIRKSLGGGCFNLWLRDDAKRRICRVYHDVPDGGTDHYGFKDFLSFDDASLLFREWVGKSEWIKNDLTDFPSCVHSQGTAYLHLKADDSIRLVFTACVPKSFDSDDFRTEQLCLEAIGEAFLSRLHAIRGERERNLLTEISKLSSMELGQEKFFEGVAKVVASEFGASGCSIFVDDPQVDALVFGGTTSGLFDRATGREFEPAELASLKYPRRFGMTGWIFNQLRTVRLFDVDDPHELAQFNESFAHAVDEEPVMSELKPVYQSAELPNLAPRSFLGAPILADGAGVGVIRLHGRQEPPYFLPSDEGLLEKVSASIGRAIHQWRAMGRSRVARRREEDLLSSIRAAIGRSDVVRGRLRIVAKQTREMFHGISASVLILDPSNSSLEVVADCSERESVPSAVCIPISEGLVGRCARERRACVAPEAKRHPDFYSPASLGNRLNDVKSEMCCPIILDGHLLGVLNVDSDIEFALNDKKLELLEKMARKAAVFLAGCVHGQTFAVDRLDSDSLLHNMQNDLSELMGLASTVANSHESDTVRLENGRKIWDKLGAKCDYLRIIGDFQAFYDKHPIDMRLEELADQLLLLHSDMQEEQRVQIEAQRDSSAVVLVDNAQLHLILANLLSNALRYRLAGTMVNVRVEEDEDEYLSISVFNEGQPIDPALIPKVGSEPIHEEAGHGVGLVLAYRLADINGGQIFCTPQENGTLFKLRLPRVDQKQDGANA